MSSEDTKLFIGINDLVNETINNVVTYVEEKHSVKIDKQDLLNSLNIKAVTKTTKSKPAEKATRIQCKQIIKKSGNQCVKAAAPGSLYCSIHSNVSMNDMPQVRTTKVVSNKSSNSIDDAKKSDLKAKIIQNQKDKDTVKEKERIISEENITIDVDNDDLEDQNKFIVETPKKISLSTKSPGGLSGKLRIISKK